jgi:hypothetical protein
MFFFILLDGAVFVRVVRLVGVGCVWWVWRYVKRRQFCCCLRVEKERLKVMKVCVLVGMVGETKNGTRCTYRFVGEIWSRCGVWWYVLGEI